MLAFTLTATLAALQSETQAETQAETPSAPDPAQQLLERLELASPKADDRLAAIVALFKQAGARDEDLEIAPLPETVAPLVERQRQALAAQLAASGLPEDRVAEVRARFEARHAALGPNVIARIPGQTERILAFGAHWDAAEASRGVLDDWAGCVLLANLYQELRESKPRHSLWFVAFSEHELGSLGSGAWVESLKRRDIAVLDAFVTVECAGTSSPMAWWEGSNASVVELAADVASRAGLPLEAVQFPGEFADGMSVRRKNIPTLCLLGVDVAHMGLLHGPEDRVEQVVPERLDETRRLLLELAREFDRHEQPLRWEYVKGMLGIGDAAGARPPIRPRKLDLSAVSVAAARASDAPPPAAAPEVSPPAPAADPESDDPPESSEDGSLP